MKDNCLLPGMQQPCVVNSFQNCIFKDERQLSETMTEREYVVNSFQNCIFKDERQLRTVEDEQQCVVNSFQNCIFKDERQPILEPIHFVSSCE